MLAELTDCTARKADCCADAIEAVYRPVNAAKGCATDPGATTVASEGTGKTAQGGETVNSNTVPTDPTTVSVEGRAR